MKTARVETALKVVQFVKSQLDLFEKNTAKTPANRLTAVKINVHINGHDFTNHVDDDAAQEILRQYLDMRLRLQLDYAEGELRLAMSEAVAQVPVTAARTTCGQCEERETGRCTAPGNQPAPASCFAMRQNLLA